MNLKNKTVTILSNNCWGTFMYKYCNLEFNSPFIGLFVFAPDYIKLLEEPSLIYALYSEAGPNIWNSLMTKNIQ